MTSTVSAERVPARCALPYRLAGPSGEAVLLIHGFTGHPGNLRFIAEGLNAEGLTVVAPRLPGHGSSRADFERTGARDWIGRALDAAADLVAEFGRDSVFVAGHSMGGAIAAIVASTFGLRRSALYAPGFSPAIPLLRLMPLIRLFVPSVPGTEEPFVDDEHRRLWEGYRKRWRTAQLAELLHVRDSAVKALRSLDCDVLVLMGERDETVRAASWDTLSRKARRARLEMVTLPGCTHEFPFAFGRREALRLTLSWLRGGCLHD